jgi:hypothetical protein
MAGEAERTVRKDRRSAGPGQNPRMLTFELLATEGAARRGRLTLNHGVVETPAFMPVGTYGTVKAVTPASLEAMGAQIILGNTFTSGCGPGSTSSVRSAACTASRTGRGRC